MTSKEQFIVREVGCPRCKVRAGQRCRAAKVRVTLLKHPHKERRDYYNGTYRPEPNAWVRSGHAKCFDPPEGCGVYTKQWNGKGQAVLFHEPGCPIEEQRLAIISGQIQATQPIP